MPVLATCLIRGDIRQYDGDPALVKLAVLPCLRPLTVYTPSICSFSSSVVYLFHLKLPDLVADSRIYTTIGMKVLRDTVLEIVNRYGLRVLEGIVRRHQEVCLADW